MENDIKEPLPATAEADKELTNDKYALDKYKSFDALLNRIPTEILQYVHFIPLRIGTKEPDIPKGAEAKDEKYRLTPEQARERIKNGGNVGIYALPGGLLFIDADTDNGKLVLPLEKLNTIPHTLTIKTRNGGRQYYFINNGKFKNKVHFHDGMKAGEVRTDWYYVVAPGSYVTTDEHATTEGNGLYQILVDAPIVTLETLPSGLTLKEDAPKRDVNINQPHTWKNDLGMSLDDIRSRDHKLDNLLNGATSIGYPSRSEADLGAAQKLYFWRFSDKEIAGIIRECRPYDKTQRDDYLQTTISKIQQGEQYKSKEKTKASSSNGDSQASSLIKYVESEDVELFHDEIHDPYARIHNSGHSFVLSIKERGFKRWLTQRHYSETGKAPGGEAISSALNVIEAKACFDGSQHILHNRLCLYDGAIWYDLGNWEAVKITSQGWEIIKNPPILFKHYKHQQKQTLDSVLIPKHRGDSVKKVLDFINIKDKKEQLLFVVYLVSCFIPDIPHPIPVLHGEKGAAKSTSFKIIKELVDPSTLKLATFPKDNAELVQRLAHHYFIGFDNVSNLSDWQSDALCRACTGEGFSKRELYTDDEDIIYSFQRCIGLNGINVVATKADLLDRSILIRLERIPRAERKSESKVWQDFGNVKAEILCGIFTVLSKAMELYPTIQLDELPRMADFTIWGCAIAEALGYGKDAFLEAYTANIQAQNREAIEGSPVGELVLKFMQDKTEWEGAPSLLLAELESIAEATRVNTKAKGFPKAAHVVVRRLNELKSNLMDEGIFFETSHSTDRIIRIWKNSVLSVRASEPNTEELEKKDATKDATKNGSVLKASEEKKDAIDRTVNNEASYIASEEKQKRETEQDAKDDKDAIFRANLSQEPEQNKKSDNELLLEQLQTYAKFYSERLSSEINSSNITSFSIDFCKLNNPIAPDGTPYTPTMIEAIASRLFKLTPTVDNKFCWEKNTLEQEKELSERLKKLAR